MDHSRKRVVCLCGARRFTAEMAHEGMRLTRGGAVAVGPEVYHPSNEATDQDRQRLGELHRRRVEFSDEVLVVNPDGSVDPATCDEITHAERLGKPVTYTHPPAPPHELVDRPPVSNIPRQADGQAAIDPVPGSVRIPACDDHGGYALTTVTVPWVCPVCGGPRGKAVRTISYDGSRRLGCDGWQNPCGHVDFYAALRREAKMYAAQTWDEHPVAHGR